MTARHHQAAIDTSRRGTNTCPVLDDQRRPCGLSATTQLCPGHVTEISTTARQVAVELEANPHELEHVLSGMPGKGPRSGTLRRSGHGEGIAASLIVGLRAYGHRCRAWLAQLDTPTKEDTTRPLRLDVAHAARTLAAHAHRLDHHPEALEAHTDIVREGRRLLRALNPPNSDEERWVTYLRSQAAAGRDAWLPVDMLLERWRYLRRADPQVGPPPSRATVYRWISEKRLATKQPPGQAALVQVGAVVLLAQLQRTERAAR